MQPRTHAKLVVAMSMGLGASTSGCAAYSANMSFAGTSAPVLLGPIDRIDGHVERADDPKLASIDVETSQRTTVGKYTYRQSETGSSGARYAMAAATQGRRDQDMRLTRVETGTWILWPVVAAHQRVWVRVQADAVKVE